MLDKITLEDLAKVDHPYYASESNYYTNFEDWPQKWRTMTDFLDEFEDADLDMNLCYRWDVLPYDGYYTDSKHKDRYCAQVTIIGQRKGIYGPHLIEYFEEHEVERFVAYVTKHWQHMQKIWAPISGVECAEKERKSWRD